MASISDPAEFDLLNDDTLGLILQFHGRDTTYLPLPFGILDKRCLEIFLSTEMAREKFLFGYAPLSVIIDFCRGLELFEYYRFSDSLGKGVFHYGRRDVFDWALQEKNQFVLGCIFAYAAGERRLDVMTEIAEKLEYIDIFEDGFCEHVLCLSAASCGHLDVLDWLVSCGFSEEYYERYADAAAANGHLNILEWIEDIGCRFDREALNSAARGGHLHILRWLREQGWRFDESTFWQAAMSGNLEILDWLQAEDCPWKDNARFPNKLSSDTQQWLRDNGYHFNLYDPEE
eukprot:CAMPEP_0178955130 /NCGR_PEP_ID=MMETSP0789-20121207/9417_1 /TAXON_ID=3005 /ORGANISM="Rhizosolenia setigera, Strain CCMP 1694" /LENGTH=287 /DNA_ID=CAMNT_0020636693 /DNA_START=202 /DNA_END=1065 /DNA_ORIENTATION=-